MLLDKKYTIVPSIKFSLTYDNGVCKVVTVKTRDKIDCSYRKNGERCNIVGIVAKIGCNFNSSLGTVGTTAYLQVDGSTEYAGQVEYIQPEQVLDLTVISTTDCIDNAVCSVDNDDQKISLIRENEVGAFQYSMDGINWIGITAAQGMSAYECAVKLGFTGTEEEWLESLKGDPGEITSGVEIFRVFTNDVDAVAAKNDIPAGKLIAITYEDIPGHSPLLYSRKKCSCNCGCDDCNCDDRNDNDIEGYKYIGVLTAGPIGKEGKPGKSAYEFAVDGGYSGTEEEFMKSLASSDVPVTNTYVGPCAKLDNTIVGPIDLRVYGFTTSDMISKKISHIDVSSPNEVDDQTVIFKDDVILRAIPTSNSAAKPNITINGRKYVSDCIMSYNGKIGVMRRIAYIDCYNGETIVSDWMSSTGELDMGAQVQYVCSGVFEEFDEETQSHYRKLHTYDGHTNIVTDDATYVAVSYPINLEKFIREQTSVATFNESFITSITLGGLPAGTVINKGDSIAAVIKKMLCPGEVPPGPGPDPKPPVIIPTQNMYWGVSDTIPTNFAGLTIEEIDDQIAVEKGITKEYLSNNQHLVIAIKQSLGEIRSIRDYLGFENIDGWDHINYIDPNTNNPYFIYYSKENLTIEEPYALLFKFKIF